MRTKPSSAAGSASLTIRRSTTCSSTWLRRHHASTRQRMFPARRHARSQIPELPLRQRWSSPAPSGPGINPGIRYQTHVTPNFHNPYAEEWSLGVQREISSKLAAEVRYVGTHTVGEFQTVNGNPQLSGLIANGFTSAFIPAGVTPCATPGTPGFAGGMRTATLRPSDSAPMGLRPLQFAAEPAQVPVLARVYGGGGLHLQQE